MIGSVLGVRYQVESLIGETPIFVLYEGRDQTHGQPVGLRLIKPPFCDEQEFFDKLAEVVEASSRLRHPAVERLIALERSADNAFVVGEAPVGPTVNERLQKLASFSVAVSVSSAIGILDALQAVHSTGAVHGEVSSRNVRVRPDGETWLCAPGLWQAYSSSETAGAMMLGQIAPYLAPEISRGAMPSTASDVYAVGILLYEMLTGRYPFHAETPVAMATKHVTDTVPSVRMMSPSVPHVLDEIIKKALAKDPAYRYLDAAAMAADLRTLQDALRFGKTLTWPLRAAAVPVSEPGPRPSAAPVRQEPKAERPEREEARPRKRDERVVYEPDVPIWIKTMIWLFSVVLLVMVGGWVFFNLSRPAEIRVPELKRLGVNEARSRLAALKLDLQVVSKEFSEDIPAEQIMRTSPASGEKVYEGRSVQAVVSSGSRFVEVPDLRGFTLDKAKAAAASVNLSISDRVDEVRDRNVNAGLVVGQVPEPRIKVERFTPIRLKISTGSGRAAPADPVSNLKYLYTVTIRLSDIEEPVILRVDMTDARGTKTVHESRRQPDESVEVSAEGYGEKATFRLFYDGEMVKQVEKKAEEP